MRHLQRRHHVGYAWGSVAPGVFSTVPGLLLLYYLTNTLGVGVGLAGVLVLAPKIVDVLVNPLVGVWSDRAESRWGPRVPFLAAGSVLLPVFLAVLFAVPHLSLGLTSLWVVVAYSLCAVGYSLFEVPYVAVPAEITDDYDERTRLNGYRMVLLTVGILVSGAVAPGIVSLGGNDRAGYALMGVVIGLVVLAFAVPSTVLIARTPIVARQTTAAPLREQLAMLRRNRPFAVLMAVYFGQALAIGAQLAGAPYFSTYTLGDKNAIEVLFVALVGPALVVMPFWVRHAERVGKSRALVHASLIYAAASVATVAAPDVPRAAVYLVTAVLGFGFAGCQMVPYAMLPDTVDDGAVETADGREAQAGGLAGLWIAGETLGFALGPTLLSLVFALGHFRSTVDAHFVTQSHAALQAVRFGFALLPPVLLLSTLPLLRTYRTGRPAGTLTGRSPSGRTPDAQPA